MNGNVTTNQTGILSPYGDFFATEPGDAALVTLPDLDTGERGTGIVHCVSAVIDRSQGGNMDLSFNGPNATAANDPAIIWCNNNYDRGHVVDGNDFEQDDLSAAEVSKLPAEQRVPDCQYTTNGYPAIPCTRDLEDYFRLWLPGVKTAMKAMSTNYTVKLTLTGDAQIRIFQAVEANGGTNYLFDETTASNQVANSASLYVGLLTASSPIAFNITTNFNEHFIFCGAQTGSAQIDLQVLDGSSNLLADATTYLQVKDIKQMYERWTVGDNQSFAQTVTPMTVPASAVNDLPPFTPAYHYPIPSDTNTPYILFVHGFNMTIQDKDHFAETEFKRLYWQGYHGRFGEFRWPTTIQSLANVTSAFDDSESNAWASATGLLNLLTNLNAEYPGDVYLTAHSHGNVVAGEALRLAGANQVVNTYIAMQGAVAAHAYDPTTPTRALNSTGHDLDSGTPNRYAHYWTDAMPCYFNGSAGAGSYVNFYNTNDYALTQAWRPDQDLKPDVGEGYGFNGTNFYEQGIYHVYIYLPSEPYKIFAYCDEARCEAIGAQANVGGAFAAGSQTDLQSIWPPDTYSGSTNYSAHVWHSAEFRSDNPSRARFWNTVLGPNGFNLK